MNVLLTALALSVLVAGAGCAADVLRSGYWRVELSEESIQSVSLDPGGRGRYGPPVFQTLSFGESLQMTRSRLTSTEAAYEGEVVLLKMDGRSESNHPYLLQPGHTLGVLFTSPLTRMTKAGLRMPTYNGKEAGAALKLWRAERTESGYRLLDVVARTRIENHKDNAWAEVEFPPQGPGTYFIEASDPVQEIGVWGNTSERPAGDSFSGSEPLGANLNFRFSSPEPFKGAVTCRVDGPHLTIAYTPGEGATFPGASFHTSWEKKGYDLGPSPFEACHSTSGQWIYFNQLKRRPHSGTMISADRHTLRGRKPFDIQVRLDPPGRFDWFCDDDNLEWRGGAERMTFTVLRRDRSLPDCFPVFECPDERLARLTTEFYLSHGANFGVGTYPDWKEWQGQILSWTANPMNAVVRLQLATGIVITPEGYVHTWGHEIGWPFPKADHNQDGQNDFDTRHFTTNPCFILGCWRVLSWNRDDAFAADVLPRVRKAMDYQLSHLKGEEGVIVTNAIDHTGKHDGIGSNYWDILPFGHKDGYSNIYFCASLEAMADIEEYALRHGIRAEGPVRSPWRYRKLAENARRVYRDTFWMPTVGRFGGCVDVDGQLHDYGFSFLNLEAASYGIPLEEQARGIFDWLDNGVSASGLQDIYSRWIFAPRSLTFHNPARDEPQTPKPSWWFFGWPGTDYDGQCQNGGAILYVSFHDLMARLRYLGPDDAVRRYREILGRYSEPDRLSGGSPLWRGELTQGGPGGTPGSVGVEGEFPESGLVPCFVLHGLMGLRPAPEGLRISPALPRDIPWIRCRNVCYGSELYTFEVYSDSVLVTRQRDRRSVRLSLQGGEALFDPGAAAW